MKEGTFESLFVDLEVGNEIVACGTIYRAPSQNKKSISDFLDCLTTLLKLISKSKTKRYIMGNMNTNLNTDTNCLTNRFTELMLEYSLYFINK